MKKRIKIKLSEESVYELVEMGVKLGLIKEGDKKEWIEFYSTEKECLFG